MFDLKVEVLETLADSELDYLYHLLAGPVFPGEITFRREASKPGPHHTAKILLTMEWCRRLIKHSQITNILEVSICSGADPAHLEAALQFIESQRDLVRAL